MSKRSIYKEISRFSKCEIEDLFFISKKTAYSVFWDIRFAKAGSFPGRILIISSKKVGSSPERNRIKRQVKSVFYEEKLYELGYAFICIVKKPLIQKSFEFVRNNLLEVINHVIAQKITK